MSLQERELGVQPSEAKADGLLSQCTQGPLKPGNVVSYLSKPEDLPDEYPAQDFAVASHHKDAFNFLICGGDSYSAKVIRDATGQIDTVVKFTRQQEKRLSRQNFVCVENTYTWNGDRMRVTSQLYVLEVEPGVKLQIRVEYKVLETGIRRLDKVIASTSKMKFLHEAGYPINSKEFNTNVLANLIEKIPHEDKYFELPTIITVLPGAGLILCKVLSGQELSYAVAVEINDAQFEEDMAALNSALGRLEPVAIHQLQANPSQS